MPGQGVSSTFKFGVAVGIIQGVAGALRLPLIRVMPTQWKAFHKLSRDKEKSRELAIRKWPDLARYLQRKKDADRAEALLIGDWFHNRVVVPSLAPEIFK